MGERGLRPHQAPAWRMFLGQIGALALHRSETTEPPQDEPAWRDLLRTLARKFPHDEPWRLVVDDWTKPAFLQPPVPKDVLSSPKRRSGAVGAPQVKAFDGTPNSRRKNEFVRARLAVRMPP